MKKLTKEEFIIKAREKHGDKYDYSLVEIKGNNKTKVKIRCNVYGVIFEQQIDNHLQGKVVLHAEYNAAIECQAFTIFSQRATDISKQNV